ncbi:BTB/POZ domain-containing protein 2-like [Brevipalpus obovatus]|uniref:BTB/POZ domain-containing protein 2-like n=1 Tax=Brevipalpus obovatus TaxID=246614 RepID=UPI003D9F8966
MNFERNPKHPSHSVTMLQGMENLYKKRVGIDVCFVFKECPEVRISAQKLVLMSVSEVFVTMFLGSLPEGDEIVIKDPEIDSEAFQRLIKYIYTGRAQFDWENIEKFLYLAHKYDISSLKADCSKYLSNNLTRSRSCYILGLADLYDTKDLVEKCTRFISQHGLSSQSSEDLLQLSLGLIIKIAKKGPKSPRNFKIVLKWLKHECKRQKLAQTPENFRKIIGDHIYLFEFSSFPIEEIENWVCPSGLLNDTELFKIMLERAKKTEKNPGLAPRREAGAANLDEWGNRRNEEIWEDWGGRDVLDDDVYIDDPHAW